MRCTVKIKQSFQAVARFPHFQTNLKWIEFIFLSVCTQYSTVFKQKQVFGYCVNVRKIMKWLICKYSDLCICTLFLKEVLAAEPSSNLIKSDLPSFLAEKCKKLNQVWCADNVHSHFQVSPDMLWVFRWCLYSLVLRGDFYHLGSVWSKW